VESKEVADRAAGRGALPEPAVLLIEGGAPGQKKEKPRERSDPQRTPSLLRHRRGPRRGAVRAAEPRRAPARSGWSCSSASRRRAAAGDDDVFIRADSFLWHY
jgi:hypothetical protein